jgi:hypothetical protein
MKRLKTFLTLALLALALPVAAQYTAPGQPAAGFSSSPPFQALAKTSVLSASTTSANVAVNTTPQMPQMLIYNNTSGIAYVIFCATSSCTATVGSGGSTTADMPVAPGAEISVTVPALTTYAAAILSTGSGLVTFTPGVGP